MFLKKYEDRLLEWKTFRETLEDSKTPYQDVLEFWQDAPIGNIAIDPYNQDLWPTPWQIIEENIYCPFVKILAICYTLQLTERFSDDAAEIHIVHDKERSESKTLLIFNQICIGYNDSKVILKAQLPKNLTVERQYRIPKIL
jgi:hypothetical protein